MNTDASGNAKLTVRLARDLVTALKRLAVRHDRSLNFEIVHALRLYVVREESETVRDDHA